MIRRNIGHPNVHLWWIFLTDFWRIFLANFFDNFFGQTLWTIFWTNFFGWFFLNELFGWIFLKLTNFFGNFGIILTSFLDEFFGRIFWTNFDYFSVNISLTYNLLTVASFRIGVQRVPALRVFGTWKKMCYMKLVLVGLYCGPLLTLIPPLTRT